MRTVRVRTAEFMAGTLPGICAITGTVARNRYSVVATGRDRTVVGAVPLNGDVVRRVQGYQRTTMSAFGCAGLAVVLAVGFRNFTAAVGALALFLVAVGALRLTRRNTVSAKLSKDGEWVDLSPAHQHFVTAVDAPPSKCAGCTSDKACSVAEMEVCESHPVSS